MIFPRGAVGSINRNPAGRGGYTRLPRNRQYDYDHRYDSAVYMDKAFRDRKIGVLKTAYEQYKEDAAVYAGPAVIETFGETGFEPVNKPGGVGVYGETAESLSGIPESFHAGRERVYPW